MKVVLKMKHIYDYEMESVLIIITGILCSILFLKLLYKLGSALPWRVNCWFCNNYFWIKFMHRNCWTCPKCEQYNGFNKDGDYNKPLVFNNDLTLNTAKVLQRSPPKNGLCKICNINQQLKVVQLANFVPMNEKKFEEEVEFYRIQLEKAYKLCSPCNNTLNMKLHKEKETLLGNKLLETRVQDKAYQQNETKNKTLKNFINNTSMYIAGILIILVSVECYRNITKQKNLSSTINSVKGILSGVIERIFSIIKMKMIMTFPSLENYLNDVNVFYTNKLQKYFNIESKFLEDLNLLTQKALGGFVCSTQIIGHVWNINRLTDTIVIDLLWSIFVISSIASHFVVISSTVVSLVKLLSAIAVLIVYRRMKRKVVKPIIRNPVASKKMKNLTSRTVNSMVEDEDTLDTDDDVSLSKFGLYNLSESSNETVSPLSSSLINGRSFTPRCNDSLWMKPKINSTFCVNSVLSKIPSSVSDTVFIKPVFNKYQKPDKGDSDSELDESISSLCIGSPKKSKKKNTSIFSLRKFTATPNFVAPTPLNRSRPLISPSKLGHSTSWVAGGYWGSEGDRPIFTANGSRSSSQSSGFESQASSMNQRNVFSQPSSREESVYREPDRTTLLLDRFQNNCNLNNYGNIQTSQNFSRMSSPMFPQMQYNSHIHIPQPRLSQQSVFPQHEFNQDDVFKAPGGTGLIKLPQVNSFASR